MTIKLFFRTIICHNSITHFIAALMNHRCFFIFIRSIIIHSIVIIIIGIIVVIRFILRWIIFSIPNFTNHFTIFIQVHQSFGGKPCCCGCLGRILLGVIPITIIIIIIVQCFWIGRITLLFCNFHLPSLTRFVPTIRPVLVIIIVILQITIHSCQSSCFQCM